MLSALRRVALGPGISLGEGGHPGRAAGLEVGQRRRRLDLAQPGRLAERLALALLEVAHDEEQEGEEAEAGGAVLGVVHDVAGRAGGRGGRRRLGERDLADVEDVAALGVDAGGGRHGALELGDLRRRDRLVDDEADAQAVDLARRDLRALDGLVDAEVGLGRLALVVRVRAARRAGRRRTGRLLALPVAPPRRGAAAAQALGLLGLLERDALLGVGELVERRLVDVEVARDLDAGLAGAERLGEHRVEAALELGVVARLGGELVDAAGAVAAPLSEFGHSSWPLASVIETFCGFRPLTELDTSEAMPRTADGSRLVGRAAQQDRGGGRRLVLGEELVLGEHERDLRARDALDLADRRGDLALERALVGDLLLEVGGAELLLVEQLEAGLALAGQALLGERDPRLRDLALDDAEARCRCS